MAGLQGASTIVVGDIGGTNTRLKLFEVKPSDKTIDGKPPGKLIKHFEYMNQDYSTFGDILKAFLAAEPATVSPPAAGCLAVAGPVESNRVNFTNRNWLIDGEELQAAFGIHRMRLINDFVANGYGLLTLDHEKECVCLQKAPAVEGAPIACVGAGTGLGECFSTCAEPGAPYETFPSEGGHAEFAPRNDLEMELLTFLKAKFKQKNRVSVERVISGPGLANVYEFLTTKFPRQVSKEVQAEFVAAGDMQGRVVAQHAGKGAGSKAPHCTLCEQALDIMLGAYGSECGVACLKWIPLRGMYVAGGLTPKNISRLTEPNSPFMAAFHDKGRLSPLLKRVPLYAVMVEDIGQRGAHLVAYKQLRSLRESTRKQANILAKWQKAAVGTGMVDDLTSTQIYAALAAICAGGFAAGALFARRRL